jgi:hypothetical protein
VSALAGWMRCGDHDSTGAGPRTTSGVTGPTAKAFPPFTFAGTLPCGSTRPADARLASARLSQPESLGAGLASPLSSKSCPSNCERSR